VSLYVSAGLTACAGLAAAAFFPGVPIPARMLIAAAVFSLAIPAYLILSRIPRSRLRVIAGEFPPAWERVLSDEVGFYRKLDREGRERFREEVALFLAEKAVTGVQTGVDDRTRTLVAASAVIPVFGIPGWEYRRLKEILVYPSDFDDDYDFKNRDADILGMVDTEGYTMILSKPSLFRGFRGGRDRVHPGIHEFAHQVDREDGELDGVPSLLLDGETAPLWEEALRREADRVRRKKSDIDPYALTDPSELFAVLAEYFFMAPGAFAKNHPGLSRLFEAVFRRDPAGRTS
jgi:hypothetical protein